MQISVAGDRGARSLGWIFLAVVGMLGGAGCSTVAVHEQRLVSKPNMEFSESVIYGYSSRLAHQIQPGLGTSGGAQPSSCTVCR